MSRPDNRARAARILVLLGVLCVGVGSCGVGAGIQLVQADSIPPAVTLPEGEASQEEAREAMNRAFEVSRAGAPYSRTLAGANAVVSALLLFGGVLLFLRRGGAIWWITQGAIANAVWVVAFAVSHISQLLATRSELVAVLGEWMAAVQRDDPGSMTFPDFGENLIWVPIGLEIVGTVLKVGFFAWLAWRIRKPDIGGMLEEAERDRQR